MSLKKNRKDYDSQLLIARLIVLGKAAIFRRGLNGRRADNMKRTLLDFSFRCFFFCFFLSQKIVAPEKEVSAEDDGREADDVSLGASLSVPPV